MGTPRPVAFSSLIQLLLICAIVTGCGQSQPDAAAPPPQAHAHHPPHGGTPVVLGDEVYHIEMVLDPPTGTLQAYILDGEMENYVRSTMESFAITAKLPGHDESLRFQAVTNRATGETVGDTALFAVQANWLKTQSNFDAVLKQIIIKGQTFENVRFNFPKGNDPDGARAK